MKFLKKVSWKPLREEVGLKTVLDAFLGGFVYATLIFFPVFVILVELMVVYMYKRYTYVVLIIVALMFHQMLIHYFAKRALYLKKEDLKADIRPMFVMSETLINVIYLIGGLLFIFVFMPQLWV